MDKPYVEINYTLANGKQIRVKVSPEVSSLFEEAERQIESEARQNRRHPLEEYVDGFTDTTAFYPQEDIADFVCRTDVYQRLYAAMNELSDMHRRRVYLYYFKGLTCRQVGELEGVSFKTVSRCLLLAVKNLRKLLFGLT